MRTHMDQPDTLSRMSGKSLSPAENARVVAAIRELLEHTSQSDLAPRLGIKQPTLSSLIGGRHGAGYGLARAVAELRGVSVEELLKVPPEDHDTAPPRLHSGAIGRHRDWSTARAGAEVKYGRYIKPGTLDRLASASNSLTPSVLTPEWVFRMAEALQQGLEDEARHRAGVDSGDERQRSPGPSKPKRSRDH